MFFKKTLKKINTWFKSKKELKIKVIWPRDSVCVFNGEPLDCIKKTQFIYLFIIMTVF